MNALVLESLLYDGETTWTLLCLLISQFLSMVFVRIGKLTVVCLHRYLYSDCLHSCVIFLDNVKIARGLLVRGQLCVVGIYVVLPSSVTANFYSLLFLYSLRAWAYLLGSPYYLIRFYISPPLWPFRSNVLLLGYCVRKAQCQSQRRVKG